MLNNNYSTLDALTILSTILQLMNYDAELKSADNDDIMHELQKQYREYFEKLLKNQYDILHNQKMIIDKLATLG